MDVSICITTYNHEKYIAECLLSIFAQEFSGDYEIVIGNDNSSDQTEAVIQKIIAEHPNGHRIKYFKNLPNLGYVKNTLFTFEKASGKYIAVLDGDDYFLDPRKLQKQFDFLENNNDFSGVGGDSLVIYEDIERESHRFSSHLNRELSAEHLTDPTICQTSTFFFRKDMLRKDFPTDIVSADRCLYLLAGCFGKVKILPDALSTYRQFSASLSKNVSYTTMEKDFAIVPFIKKYGRFYRLSQLKTYFYYTLMSYSTKMSKADFVKAAAGYAFYNIMAKFTLSPLKLYHVLKWTNHTVKQKYAYKRKHQNFV